MMIVDFHIFGESDRHFRPTRHIHHSGLILGRFDVPFGLDWQVYPSIDRKLVTMPMSTELFLDSWNDLGGQFYIEAGRMEATLYAVNGYGYQQGYNADGDFLGYNGFGYIPDSPDIRTVDRETAYALGGRSGLRIWDRFRIGGSYAGFLNGDNRLDMSLHGVDLQFDSGDFRLKGEFIEQQIGQDNIHVSRNRAYYFQPYYRIDPFFLVARYEQLFPDNRREKNLTRSSFGVGWVLDGGIEFRAEYRSGTVIRNEFFLQCVVMF